MASAEGAAGLRADARAWAGLAVLTLPCLVVAMNAHLLTLAVPRLSAHLGPSSTQLLWIVDVYVFFLAGSLLTMGTLGDRIGRRRLLGIGAAAYAAASLLAAFAPTAAALIAARAVLGVAGATLMPSTLALIREMFPDRRQRTTALGVWTASFALGGVAGPVVGGLLLEAFWWGSVFLVAVPVMLLLVAVGPLLLPECRDPAPTRLDLPSAAVSLAAVLAVVYGLKQAAQDGFSASSLFAVGAGAVLGVTFVRRQRQRTDPLVDLDLFGEAAFTIPLVTNALAFFVLYGTQVAIAQHLQLVLGLSPLHAGLWTIPSALGYLAGSVLGPTAARRAHPRYVISAGLVLAAAGFALLALLPAVGSGLGLAVLVAGSVIFSIGLAPVYLLATEMTIAAAPPHRTGAASALSETGAELGGALGIAVLGSISAAIYRSMMATAIPPDLPQPTAAAARSTLGGAVAAAQHLPDHIRTHVLDTARGAFERGFAISETVGAALLTAASIAVVLLLRGDQAADLSNSHKPTDTSGAPLAGLTTTPTTE